jgi:hypothetical protein
MAWNPEENLSNAPLQPSERKDVRRVLKWYERRVFFQASLRVWGLWLLGLPTCMLALWGLAQAFLHGR